MANEALTFTGDRGVQEWDDSGAGEHSALVTDPLQAKYVRTIAPDNPDRYDMSVPTGSISILTTLEVTVYYGETNVGDANWIQILLECLNGDSVLGTRTGTLATDLSPYSVVYSINLTGGPSDVADLNFRMQGQGGGWPPGAAAIQIYLIEPVLHYGPPPEEDQTIEVHVGGTVSSGVALGCVSAGEVDGRVSSGVTLGRVDSGEVGGHVSSGEVRGTVEITQEHEDLTFIFGLDTHYGWHIDNPNAGDYADNLNTVEDMNLVPGLDYPPGIDGVVDTPSFAIVPGDILHDGTDYPTSYNTFISHYGSNGEDGVLNYKVYICRGNHDGEQAINDLIVARHGARNYVFYEKGIAFICCDLFPQSADTIDDYFKNSDCTMAWLQTQLEAIGKSRHIVLFQHYDYQVQYGVSPGWSWWGTTDADELAALIKGYNIVAILHGHDHGTQLPGDADLYAPFKGYTVLSPYKGTFYVIKITKTRFMAGQRNPVSHTWLKSGGRTQNNPIKEGL